MKTKNKNPLDLFPTEKTLSLMFLAANIFDAIKFSAILSGSPYAFIFTIFFWLQRFQGIINAISKPINLTVPLFLSK